MKKLSVGIIGQGRSGRKIHAVTIAKLPELFKIVAVCDREAARCEASKNDFGCDTYVDYHEMMKHPEPGI